jgi:hypothetical protein
VLFWVPVPEIAAALDDLPGATVQVVSPDGGPLPASADEVEFYVPPFFPAPPAIEVIAHLPGLRVVQALTAGIDRLLPYIQPGVTLCNARPPHHPARGGVDAGVGGAFARVRAGSGRAVHQRAATAERHRRELLTCHRCYGPFGRSSSIEA